MNVPMYIKTKYLLSFGSLTLLLLIFSLLTPCSEALAQRLSDINPIMSFSEQAKRLNAECRGRDSDPLCQKKRVQMHKVLQELRALCVETPDDDRCGAIRRKRPVSKLKQFCFENPFEYKCVRRRELAKIREKHKRKYCAKNPDAVRCHSRATKRSAYMTFSEYCKAYPKKRRCIDRKKRENRNKPKKDPEANSF